jgi:hypothetical protein
MFRTTCRGVRQQTRTSFDSDLAKQNGGAGKKEPGRGSKCFKPISPSRVLLDFPELEPSGTVENIPRTARGVERF